MAILPDRWRTEAGPVTPLEMAARVVDEVRYKVTTEQPWNAPSRQALTEMGPLEGLQKSLAKRTEVA